MRGEASATPRAARSLRYALFGLVAASALALAPAAAQADVAYVGADKEIWISSLDGAIKERLSAGEGDWLDTAQSDTGWVVGVRNTPGRIAVLSTFRVWNPQGAAVYNGPLAGEVGGLSAYPLSLDLTNDGRGIIYGFSRYQQWYGGSSLTEGHYFLPSETVVSPVGGPYKQINKRYPTLFGGSRVVAAVDRVTAGVQDSGSIASETFVPWLDFSGVALVDVRLRRTDVAASGRVIAFEVTDGSQNVTWIGVAPVSALGGTFGPGDCFLPTDGNATSASLSQDGSAIAWTDSGGVKVGGIPDFSGADPCVLTRPVVIIAGGGGFPSIGAMSAAAIRAARTPAVVPPPPPPPTAAPKSGSGSASPTPPPASVKGRSVSVSIPALAAKAGKCPARAMVVVTAGPGLRASRLLPVVAATVGGRKVCRVTGVVRLARAPAKGVKVKVSVSGTGLRAKVVVAIRR